MTRSVWKGPFVDITLMKKAEKLSQSGRMVGHKLGEFSPTRTFKGHTAADKKAEQK